MQIDQPITITASALAVHLGVDLDAAEDMISRRRLPDGSVMFAVSPAGDPARARIRRADLEEFQRRAGITR